MEQKVICQHHFHLQGKSKEFSLLIKLTGFFVNSFFPSPISPIISVFANTIFEIFVKIKLCKPFVKKYNVASSSNITITIPGPDAADADRRRFV
jgi:hypothetical protein